MHLEDGSSKMAIDAEAEPNVTIELSISGVVVLTSDSNAYVYSKDDPNI